MPGSNWSTIILAAGKGKRMKSELPKVLHKIAGIPMVLRVYSASREITDKIIIVVGHGYEKVKKAFLEKEAVKFALQKEQNGTGDAVKAAIEFIDPETENIMVLCGDTPLIKGETLKEFAEKHEKLNADASVLAMEVENPKGYGRLVINKEKRILKIVEESDADDSQKEIKKVNTGIYCFKKDFLIKGVQKLNCDNAQKEYYLTDLIKFGYGESAQNLIYHTLKKPEEAMGVNSPEELEKAESFLVAKLSVA